MQELEFEQKDDLLILHGMLTFATVEYNRQAILRYFGKNKKLTLDLAGITASDSAGLALLLTWKRYASEKNVTLEFTNFPDKLLTVAEVSDVAAALTPQRA